MKKADWIILGVLVLFIGFLVKIFKRQDLAQVKDMNPEVMARFSNFLTDVRKLGYTPVIRESTRTFEQQQQYYKQDKRNAKPGHSTHEQGLAIDMDLHKGGKILSKKTPRAAWINTGVPALAQQYGIRWGGDFKGYADNNHFDLKKS